MSHDPLVPQRPISYRLPSNRLPLAHNSAIISLVHGGRDILAKDVGHRGTAVPVVCHATAVHRRGQDHGNPALKGGEHVMSGLAVGFSPPHPAPERVTTRGWARDDVLPGINAGASSATRHILPTPMDCGRMVNDANCGWDAGSATASRGVRNPATLRARGPG
jgi:hypothetical protein